MDTFGAATPFADATAPGTSARAWVEAYAQHVRKRHQSRVVVSVRVAGSDPVELSQIYALEGGGLVLVQPRPDEGEGGGGGHGRGENRHGEHDHGEHGYADLNPLDREIWLATLDRVVFELRHAPDGELCTGFGYLGASRTPHVLVARDTEPPPVPDHHAHDF